MSHSASSASRRPLPRPVAFGGSAGWLHAGGTARGVILCGAQGFEALCAYQSWRILADLAADRGATVLRFDYPGEGDSLDPASGVDPVEAWIAAIRAAMAWMREDLGIETISLAGFRLGALLASEALRDCGPVQRLALIAPVMSGKSYIRECRAAARIFAASKAGSGDGDSGIHICGHVLTEAMVQSLSGRAIAGTAHADAVLIARGDSTEEALSDAAIAGLGGPAQGISFAGYAGMIAPPTAAVTPLADLAGIAEWLADGASEAAPAAAPGQAALAGDGFIETRVVFGPDATLAGVLCMPQQLNAATRTVLMLNAGANNHFGWARMNVEHARGLAAHGVASLRMDFTGIGDSVWRESGPRPLLYSRQHIADVRAATDYLVQAGHRSILPVGACAGGFAAFHALHQDHRLDGAVIINVLRLLWHDTDTLDEAERALNQSSSAYAAQAFSGHAWKRILTGDVSAARIWGIFRLLSGKVLSRVFGPAAAALGVEIGLSADARAVRAIFRDIAQRGARLSLVYADRDAGRDEIDRHMGANAALARKLAGVSIDLVPDGDHELTPRAARDQLFDLVLRRAGAG